MIPQSDFPVFIFTTPVVITEPSGQDRATAACVARQNPVAGKITDSGSRVVTNGEIF